MANPMGARCGEAGCDCGHTIEKLVDALRDVRVHATCTSCVRRIKAAIDLAEETPQ